MKTLLPYNALGYFLYKVISPIGTSTLWTNIPLHYQATNLKSAFLFPQKNCCDDKLPNFTNMQTYPCLALKYGTKRNLFELTITLRSTRSFPNSCFIAHRSFIILKIYMHYICHTDLASVFHIALDPTVVIRILEIALIEEL